MRNAVARSSELGSTHLKHPTKVRAERSNSSSARADSSIQQNGGLSRRDRGQQAAAPAVIFLGKNRILDGVGMLTAMRLDREQCRWLIPIIERGRLINPSWTCRRIRSVACASQAILPPRSADVHASPSKAARAPRGRSEYSEIAVASSLSAIETLAARGLRDSPHVFSFARHFHARLVTARFRHHCEDAKRRSNPCLSFLALWIASLRCNDGG